MKQKWTRKPNGGLIFSPSGDLSKGSFAEVWPAVRGGYLLPFWVWSGYFSVGATRGGQCPKGWAWTRKEAKAEALAAIGITDKQDA